jgi:hypothetical protein
MTKHNPPKCPKCNAPGVTIAYGYRGPELWEAERRGENFIGGCIHWPGQPEFHVGGFVGWPGWMPTPAGVE